MKKPQSPAKLIENNNP